MERTAVLRQLRALGVIGVSVQAATCRRHCPPVDAVLLVALVSDRVLAADERDRALATWRQAAAGTLLDRVDAIVVDHGVDVQIRGHQCARPGKGF